MNAFRKAVPFCFALLLVGAPVAGREAAEPGPGRHLGVACKDSPGNTYDLYIPRVYAVGQEQLFPALFIHSPGGRPGTQGLESWAERRGVIIVSVNGYANRVVEGAESRAAGWAKIDLVQDAVIDSVESSVRIHPCLRFSMGFSGAAWASMRMAGNHNDKHAGVLMCAHSGNSSESKLARHIAVAFVHAENDDVHGPGAVRSSAKNLKGRGNPVREVCGDWGHSWGPRAEHERMLDWMLEVSRLIHPNLSPSEKARARADIKGRVEALAGEEDASARLKGAETLLGLPGAETWPETRELLAAWFSAKFELTMAAPGPVARHEALTALSEDKRLVRCAPGDRKRLSKELKGLRRKSPVRNEWKAELLYRQIAEFEKKCGRARTKLTQAAQSYGAIARRYSKTKAGRKAKEAAQRLVADINSGKTR